MHKVLLQTVQPRITLRSTKSRGLCQQQWHTVLPDVLHSIRTLLCTSINCTPRERLFNYQRRSSSGQSIPTWLSKPGTILMKCNVRQTKYEPVVDEVELIEANPQMLTLGYRMVVRQLYL